LEIRIHAGSLKIVQEGRTRKFVKSLQQLMFNPIRARRGEQSMRFVTERCVFDVEPGGLRLIEVAPGIDVERDIVAQMDFRPAIASELRPMVLPSQ
jgi:propionate CoA-transferase